MSLAIGIVLLVCALLLRSLLWPTLVGAGLGLGAVFGGPMVNLPVDSRLAFLMLAGGFAVGVFSTIAKLVPEKKKDGKKK